MKPYFLYFLLFGSSLALSNIEDAEQYFENKNYQACIDTLPGLKELHTQRTLYLLASAYAKLAQWEKAKDAFLIYIDNFDATDRSLYSLGVIEKNLGNLDAANSYFQQIKLLSTNRKLISYSTKQIDIINDKIVRNHKFNLQNSLSVGLGYDYLASTIADQLLDPINKSFFDLSFDTGFNLPKGFTFSSSIGTRHYLESNKALFSFADLTLSKHVKWWILDFYFKPSINYLMYYGDPYEVESVVTLGSEYALGQTTEIFGYYKTSYIYSLTSSLTATEGYMQSIKIGLRQELSGNLFSMFNFQHQNFPSEIENSEVGETVAQHQNTYSIGLQYWEDSTYHLLLFDYVHLTEKVIDTQPSQYETLCKIRYLWINSLSNGNDLMLSLGFKWSESWQGFDNYRQALFNMEYKFNLN